MSASYVNHVAMRVADLGWYLDFFGQALQMQVTLTAPEEAIDDPLSADQVWIGGVQLQKDPSARSADLSVERLNHIGIDVADVDAALERAYAYDGVVQAPGKPHNWMVLPDGTMLEICQG